MSGQGQAPSEAPRAGAAPGDPGAGGASSGGWMARHGAGHPAPARGQASSAALWFGLFAAPAAWSVQTLVNYSLAAHSCYPALYPRGTPAFGGLWAVTLGVSLLATAVGVAAGRFAYREWTRTSGETGGGAGGRAGAEHALQGSQQGGGSGGSGRSDGGDGGGDGEPTDVRAALEIGEGRTRFMAMSGILTSVVFVTASLLHGLSVFLVQPCGT